MAVVAPPASAKPDKSGRWQEGGIADAMMCDLDGDGTPSQYETVNTSTVLYYEALSVDGNGVTHGVLQEQLDNVEYYSAEAKDSIYVTGRTKYVGTLTGEGETLALDDGKAMVRYKIRSAPGGILIGRVAGDGQILDGVVDEDNARFNIAGPCGVPYEPSE
jgi:hypothetical protein